LITKHCRKLLDDLREGNGRNLTLASTQVFAQSRSLSLGTMRYISVGPLRSVQSLQVLRFALGIARWTVLRVDCLIARGAHHECRERLSPQGPMAALRLPRYMLKVSYLSFTAS
jgi:hypothetical protein